MKFVVNTEKEPKIKKIMDDAAEKAEQIKSRLLFLQKAAEREHEKYNDLHKDLWKSLEDYLEKKGILKDLGYDSEKHGFKFNETNGDLFMLETEDVLAEKTRIAMQNISELFK